MKYKYNFLVGSRLVLLCLGVLAAGFFIFKLLAGSPQAFAASNTLGNTSIGASTDTGDSDDIDGAKFTMPNEAGTVTSMSVYMGSMVSPAPNNQLQLAIYSDNAGSPGSLIVNSSSHAITADAWNTVPISADLSANATYWLMMNTNGIGEFNDNFKFNIGTPNQMAWKDQTFGTWPSTFGTADGSSDLVPSIYATYTIVNPPPAGSVTVDLTPVADTYLNVNSTNFSASPTLNIYTWPTNKIANAILMKFNLSAIPAGATISSGILHVYLTSADTEYDTAYNIPLHKLINKDPDLSLATGYTYDGTHAWTASNCCFDNIPLAQSDITPARSTTAVNKVNGFKTWDATSIVSEWINTPSTNFGLLLNSDPTQDANVYRFFASMENSSSGHRPFLRVVYTPAPPPPPVPPPPPSPTPIANGQVVFSQNGTFAGSPNLFWDNVKNFLGIGTSTPQARLDVIGDILASGKLTIASIAASGAITANSITASTTITGANITATGNLTANTITSGSSINGVDITSTGTITANQLVLSGNLVTSGNITANNLTANNALNVGGNISAASLGLTGNANVAGNLNVSGIISTGGLTLTGNLTTPGSITAGNINGTNISAGTITGNNLVLSGNLVTSGNITVNNITATAGITAATLTVGLNGITNPAFNVDASAVLSATGINIKSAAANGGLALSVTSSAPDENLFFNAKGAGTINIGNTSTGDVLIAGGSAVTGCTIANASGNLSCSGALSSSNFSGSSSGINTGDQNVFSTFTTTSGTNPLADTTTDTLAFIASAGISITGNSGVDSITIANTDLGSSQKIFKNIAVSGQNAVVSDINNDTLTLVAGTSVSITTNSTTDTVTINATASGNVSTALNLTDNAIVRGDGGTTGLQTSGIVIDDTNNVTGIATLSSGAITTGNITTNGEINATNSLVLRSGGTNQGIRLLTSPGGSIELAVGFASSFADGGEVIIQGGSSPNGMGGRVQIKAGDSTTGIGGDIELVLGQSSSGPGTDGILRIRGKEGTLSFNTSNLHGLKTISFPDASGTVPLLSTDQTFTGLNKFEAPTNSTIYVGSSIKSGCIVMGNSDGAGGFTYITANHGVLTPTVFKPPICQ